MKLRTWHDLGVDVSPFLDSPLDLYPGPDSYHFHHDCPETNLSWNSAKTRVTLDLDSLICGFCPGMHPDLPICYAGQEAHAAHRVSMSVTRLREIVARTDLLSPSRDAPLVEIMMVLDDLHSEMTYGADAAARLRSEIVELYTAMLGPDPAGTRSEMFSRLHFNRYSGQEVLLCIPKRKMGLRKSLSSLVYWWMPEVRSSFHVFRVPAQVVDKLVSLPSGFDLNYLPVTRADLLPEDSDTVITTALGLLDEDSKVLNQIGPALEAARSILAVSAH